VRLVERWPGLFIPNLPEKSVTGNLENKFIERRKRLLNAFLNRCTDLPYLYLTEVFKVFIRGGPMPPNDNLLIRNPEQIFDNYKNLFQRL